MQLLVENTSALPISGQYLSTSTQTINGFVLCWEGYTDSLGAKKIVYQRVTQDGASLSDPIIVASDTDTHVPHVTLLENGSVVVTWARVASGFRLTEFRVFDSNNQMISSGVASQNATDDYINTRVMDLGGGKFVIYSQVHDDFPATGSFGQVMRVFNYDGSPVTSEVFVVQGAGDNHRSAPIETSSGDIGITHFDSTNNQVVMSIYYPESLLLKSSTVLHSFTLGRSGNVEQTYSPFGTVISFRDGDTSYVARVADDGTLLGKSIVLTVAVDTFQVSFDTYERCVVTYSVGGATYVKAVNVETGATILEPTFLSSGNLAEDSHLEHLGGGKFTLVLSSATPENSSLPSVQIVKFSIDGINTPPAGSVTITGSTIVGQTVNIDTSGISDSDGIGTFVSYAWFADGVAVANGYGSTTNPLATQFPLSADLLGKVITVQYSYYDAAGNLETVTSAGSLVTAPINNLPAGSIAVIGSTEVGQTVHVDTSGVVDADGFGSFVSYAWYIDGTYIDEGRSATSNVLATGYPLFAADVGKTITVKYTYRDGLGNLETVTSAGFLITDPEAINGTLDADIIDGTSAADRILGYASDDTLHGGEGDDSLFGGAGDDLLSAGSGHNFVDGGDGNDVFVFQYDGNTTVNDTAGGNWLRVERPADTLYFSKLHYNAQGVLVLEGMNGSSITFSDPGSLSGIQWSTFTPDNVYSMYSMPIQDLAIGTLGNDVLSTSASAYVEAYGADGNDQITILAGSSWVTGDSGSDVVYGGSGNDAIHGDFTAPDTGNDTLFGGGGNDTIWGEAGQDVLDGGDGDDTLKGDDGDDSLDGGAGNDSLSGGIGNDTLFGGSGSDVIYSDEGDDLLFGGSGNDLLRGSYGDDTLYGGTGDDSFVGEVGNDFIFGGEGNDYFVIQYSADTIFENSAEGNDTVNSSISYILTENVENLVIFEDISLKYQYIDGTGNSLANILTGNISNNILAGKDGDDTIEGGAGNDTLYGGEGEDTLYGGSGDDLIYGGTGHNFVDGGEGNDIFVFQYDGNTTVSDKAGGNWIRVERPADTLYFSKLHYNAQGVLVLEGMNGSSITINDPANLLGIQWATTDPLAGYSMYSMPIQDLAIGTLGNDVLSTSASAYVEAYGADGNDQITILAGSSWVTGDSGSDVVYGGSGNDAIHGDFTAPDTGNDTLFGGGGNDVLWGEAGQDVLNGGDGDDLLKGDNGDDSLEGGAGIDTVEGGAGNDILNGGAGDDFLYGGAGNDTINDGVGIDVIDGGDGIDTFTRQYDGIDYSIVLAYDLARGFAYSPLTPNTAAEYFAVIENISVKGGYTFLLTGDDFNNVLETDAGNDTLNGAVGADTLIGGAGNDTYITDGADTIVEVVSAGTDTVDSSASFTLVANLENLVLTGSAAINGTGNGSNNVVTGNSGNNILNGGTGADTLIGGDGNDTYITDGGDTLTEIANAGTDTVQASVTYTLGANLENLSLSGSGAINGTGNTLDNAITGNSGNNSLSGAAGNDTLNGGTGTDTLVGGAGNDTYITDGGDTITETANAGTDTVQSTVTYTLGANLENLTLTGSASINGTGNALNNLMTGNSGNNILNGGAGTDTLNGGDGNDTYVTNGGDTIIEAANAGTDTVQSSVTYTLTDNLENLTLTGNGAINGTGNALSNVLVGNTGANTLVGGGGSDTMIGGAGRDILTGGLDNDTFVFRTISESGTATASIDRITDFVQGQDKIDLSQIDAFTGGTANDTFIWRGTSAFQSTTSGEVRYQLFDNAGTSNDYTQIYLDNDGDTGVESTIQLTGLYTLTASDFIL